MTPSITEMFAAPQLAVLHILDVALETAIAALIAAHLDPLWEGGGIQFEERPDPDVIRAAEDILERAQSLRAAITWYQPDTTPPWISANDRLDAAESRQLTFDLAGRENIPF